MAPTYQDGDWLLVQWLGFSAVTAKRGEKNRGKSLLGKVVVVEREERPGIFLVKRLQKSHGGEFWVEGDNDESTDSRTWGWISGNEIVGVVLFRYRKNRTDNKPEH